MKGANPKEQGTNIAIDENYTEDKRRYTDRIVDEHACELVEVSRAFESVFNSAFRKNRSFQKERKKTGRT